MNDYVGVTPDQVNIGDRLALDGHQNPDGYEVLNVKLVVGFPEDDVYQILLDYPDSPPTMLLTVTHDGHVQRKIS